MPRLVKVASPDALVDAVVLPISVPAPGLEAIPACTAMPASATALPFASWIWIVGWVANAAPLAAVLDGWRVITTPPAEPTVAVEVNWIGEPFSPFAVAVVVCVPAVAPSVRATAERPSVPVGSDEELTAPPPVSDQVT